MIKKQSYTHNFVTGEGGYELTFTTVNVTAEARPLRAVWSPDIINDLQVFHNINAENELVALLSEQVATEIDNEILTTLRQDTVDTWSSRFDLNEPYPHRENIAQLYENQAQQIIHEETNDTTPFEHIRFPMVRQVFSTATVNNFDWGNRHYNAVNELSGKLTWLTDESWVYENLYGSRIGIQMELKPHIFIPKKNPLLFDEVTMPSVSRAFI